MAADRPAPDAARRLESLTPGARKALVRSLRIALGEPSPAAMPEASPAAVDLDAVAAATQFDELILGAWKDPAGAPMVRITGTGDAQAILLPSERLWQLVDDAGDLDVALHTAVALLVESIDD